MQHLLQALISIGNPLNIFKKMSPKPTIFHCNGTYVLPEVAMLLQMFFFMVLQYFQLLMSYQIP